MCFGIKVTRYPVATTLDVCGLKVTRYPVATTLDVCGLKVTRYPVATTLYVFWSQSYTLLSGNHT